MSRKTIITIALICSVVIVVNHYINQETGVKKKLALEKKEVQHLSIPAGIEIPTLTNIEEDQAFKEWCQLDYQDLSRDPIFKKFDSWLKEYAFITCKASKECGEHDHTIADPRRLFDFIEVGKELALERYAVLQKIIRGDPETAISLAYNPGQLSLLPDSVLEHMEKWRSAFADIQSMHVCFDPKHPGGYINRTAKFSDGKELRAWVFGKRKNLPSIRGLSVWGIVIGNDFAISDKPIFDVSTPEKNMISFGGAEIPYESEEELMLFEHEVNRSEKEAYLKLIPVRYPRLATSSGLTDYYNKKYDLVSNTSTWLEAKTAAEENNGTLVIINSEVENRFIQSLFKKRSAKLPWIRRQQ